MTCPYCGEPIKPNEGYPQWKCRYHSGCWENKIRRETREDFDKSVARKLEYKSGTLSKKERSK